VSATIVLMDAHVHVYPGVDVAGLLSAAAREFRKAAERLGASRWRAVLFLTEIASVDWFESVVASGGATEIGPWTLALAPDDPLRAEARGEGATLDVVAGRQIVTAERVEVHALGTRAKIPDGMDLPATLAAVRAADALAVLPWGVGKWVGARRALVSKILRSTSDVYLSDNGGRPGFWREPLLARARLDGRPVLSGSDPLPLPAEEYRVGGFGCWLSEGSADRCATRQLLARIRSSKAGEIEHYGPPETALRFIGNQVALRVRRRA
jgi:hypothetical protein